MSHVANENCIEIILLSNNFYSFCFFPSSIEANLMDGLKISCVLGLLLNDHASWFELFLLRNQSYLLSFYPLIAYWMPSFSLYYTTSCLSFPKNSHNIGGHCDFWTPCSSIKMKEEFKNRECNSCEEHGNHLTTLHNSQNNPAVFLQDITSVLISL